jgi:hypothetical protein
MKNVTGKVNTSSGTIKYRSLSSKVEIRRQPSISVETGVPPTFVSPLKRLNTAINAAVRKEYLQAHCKVIG